MIHPSAINHPDPAVAWPRRSRNAGVVLATASLIVAWALILVGNQPVRGEGAGDVNTESPLRSIPFDRIWLSDGKSVIIETVSPRPLPAYDPSKEKRKDNAPPEEGNVLTGAQKAKADEIERQAKEQEQFRELTIHLLQWPGEQKDFVVKRAFIQRIEYFEDLLLAEGERYVLAGDYARAFECYLRVQNRQPRWPELGAHVNRLLFAEGSRALLDGDGEKGLRLLGELFERDRDFPGLQDKFANSFGSRAKHAFELGLYAKGRKILHDLEPLAPGHPVLRATRELFETKARSLADEAAKQKGLRRLDMLAEALRVWPRIAGVPAQYEQSFRAEPTLVVAVNDQARPLGPWIRSPADSRMSRLLYLPILAGDDDDSIQGKSPGQLAKGMDSEDLGRKLKLRLRSDVRWSDGSRPVSAIDVARSLTDRAEVSSPHYNARWAEQLEKVTTSEDQTQVNILLTRPFRKPASWLTGPVGPGHASWDGRVITGDGQRILVGDGPYRLESATADRLLLRSADSSKVRYVREVSLKGANATIGALVRGEVTLVEHVPPDQVAQLTANPEIKVGRYAHPALHWIALDGRNPALRGRELRRAISYAINRREILEETILRRPADAANVVSDGPFPKGSYANAIGTEPFGYDPLLAKGLVGAARKVLGLGKEPIKLTLEYPALAEPQAVMPRVVESLRLIGIDLKAIERSESELERELRSGRRFDLVYRVARVGDPIEQAGAILCPGYDAPPETMALATLASPRILQLLLQLDVASEFPTARDLAIQIDGESRDELPIIPLWQVEDHYAWRTRLKGPAEVSEALYQGLSSWEIEPWYAKDSW